MSSPNGVKAGEKSLVSDVLADSASGLRFKQNLGGHFGSPSAYRALNGADSHHVDVDSGSQRYMSGRLDAIALLYARVVLCE